MTLYALAVASVLLRDENASDDFFSPYLNYLKVVSKIDLMFIRRGMLPDIHIGD